MYSCNKRIVYNYKLTTRQMLSCCPTPSLCNLVGGLALKSTGGFWAAEPSKSAESWRGISHCGLPQHGLHLDCPNVDPIVDVTVHTQGSPHCLDRGAETMGLARAGAGGICLGGPLQLARSSLRVCSHHLSRGEVEPAARV